MLELMLDLLDRAARGFLFALPAAIFWFAALCFRKRGRTAQHMGLSLVFLFYLSGVLAMTGIGRPFGFFPRLALVPFVDMIKGPVDTTLNVLLFLPLGVFLPILYAEFDGIRQIALCAFALSLAIELTQMFGLGITDVNDLMTNTACAGEDRHCPDGLYRRTPGRRVTLATLVKGKECACYLDTEQM